MLVALVCLISILFLPKLFQTMRLRRELMIALKIDAYVEEAHERLLRWMIVRPFVYVGHCPYARSLVIEMINALEEKLRLAPTLWRAIDRDSLKNLIETLQEPPPTYPGGSREPPFFDYILISKTRAEGAGFAVSEEIAISFSRQYLLQKEVTDW